jgi:hypothetical protein
LILAALLVLPSCSRAQAPQGPEPLVLERTIPLPDTKGRIDHLAIDLERHRLFVAEVANGTVDEIDLEAGKVVGRIAGLSEPQGLAWLSVQHELVVACGDGTVHFFDADRREVARIDLGDDADNVRIDARNGHVVVGYGGGDLATIDAAGHRVIARLALPGHPEGFRLFGSRAYVNVPGNGSIIAVDLDLGRQLGHWPTGLHRLNFPMAVAPSGATITIAYRLPAALATIDTTTGKTLSLGSTCGDADDLFLVGDRALVVCGAGHVDVVSPNGSERVQTRSGARTGLYVPELGALFVAAPARGGPAAILSLRANFTPR